LFPSPTVHANLASLAALSAADEDRAATLVQVVSASASASLILNPARQRTTSSARSRMPSVVLPTDRMTWMISSTVGGSAG